MSEMMSIDVSLAQSQYDLLMQMAEERKQPIADLLSSLIEQVLTATQQEANYQMVQEAYRKYPGQYVAIYQGQILTHAADAETLLKRVQCDFSLTSTDVLLVKAKARPELRVHHPQLIESL